MRAAILELDAVTQLRKCLFIRNVFDLDQIGLGQFVTRITDVMLQPSGVGEQQQSLAVAIEATGGIDMCHIDEILQRGTALRVGELRQHIIGFVEQDQQAHFSRADGVW